MRIQQEFGTGVCRTCGSTFRKKRQNQSHCSGGSCHDRSQHNHVRWVITRVVDGKCGGYSFTVKINDSPPMGGFHVSSLYGYLRYPERLILKTHVKRRMRKPLLKQLRIIVTTNDPRYHRHDGATKHDSRAEYDRLLERWNSAQQWETTEDFDACARRIRELEQELGIPVEDQI